MSSINSFPRTPVKIVNVKLTVSHAAPEQLSWWLTSPHIGSHMFEQPHRPALRRDQPWKSHNLSQTRYPVSRKAWSACLLGMLRFMMPLEAVAPGTPSAATKAYARLVKRLRILCLTSYRPSWAAVSAVPPQLSGDSFSELDTPAVAGDPPNLPC
ncbi:hypothetical protein PsYK624_156810 [Phanerochaete sordida]|uniref:Uncharacterized protein n=1 Tax=Phanerochaete sordida TaxID=48140 RepID=A0A9P3GS95_9APHY|nr:hypothetical protein PsYK624_156810 [Phanerochaete sordida]